VHLEQIEVSYAGDDQVLFNSIQEAYGRLRMSYALPLPKILTSLIGDVTFSRHLVGQFVKVRFFQLVDPTAIFKRVNFLSAICQPFKYMY
jgi:hypothetical protein